MKYACVFIGANTGKYELYAQETVKLANELVKRNIGLVYGGASIGLMGLLANTVLDLGGEVIGVMPDALIKKEISHQNLTKLHQVNSMSDRKILLAELSDFFIVFPGGLGTLDELFEIWNAQKMGLHQKRIGVLNIGGYFDSLFQFLKNVVCNNFMKQQHLELIAVADNAVELFENMGVG